MSPVLFILILNTGVNFQRDWVLFSVFLWLTLFCKKMHEELGSHMMGCGA